MVLDVKNSFVRFHLLCYLWKKISKILSVFFFFISKNLHHFFVEMGQKADEFHQKLVKNSGEKFNIVDYRKKGGRVLESSCVKRFPKLAIAQSHR